jgi:hypothetical protein
MKARSALGLAFFGKSPSLPMRCMWHRMPTRRIRGYSVRRKSIRAGWSRQGSGYLFGIGHFAFRHRFGFGFEVAASPAVWSAVHDHGGWLSVRFASLVLEDIASDNATLILIGRGFGRFGTMPHCPVWARSNRTHPFPSSGGGIGVTDLDCRISQSGGPGVQRQQCRGPPTDRHHAQPPQWRSAFSGQASRVRTPGEHEVLPTRKRLRPVTHTRVFRVR